MSAQLVLVLYLYRLVNGDEHKRGAKIFDAPGIGSLLICRSEESLPDF
jgi:hypothetical protein